jgi:hypothetical protein
VLPSVSLVTYGSPVGSYNHLGILTAIRPRTIRGVTMRMMCAAILLAFAVAPTWANCIGSPGFQTCYDNSGNSYQVNRMGNTTTVQGYNAQTGSSWNQTSQQVGNSTYTNGTAANGQPWNSTTMNMGNGNTMTYGTDSRGNSFQRNCNQYGCY